MQRIKNHHSEILFSFLSISAYLLSLVISHFDPAHTYRWVVFLLHMYSLLFVGILYLVTNRIRKISDKEIFSCTLIILAAIVVHITYLKYFPFVALGDEVRDAGLDAMRIVHGNITNLSGFGNYNGYGEIIPTLASFFYRVFGQSVFTYRVPSALVAILDTILVYILIRKIAKRGVSMLGSLIYTTFPLVMLYARTELVVAFDSFWTSAILLSYYVWLQKKNMYRTIFLATILGIAMNFHAAAKAVGVVMLCITLLVIFFEKNSGVKKKIVSILAVLVFVLVGFGPMILQTTPKNFLLEKSIVANSMHAPTFLNSQMKRAELAKNYSKSLMVWFYEGTTSRYVLHTPLLTPLLALLFLLGIGYAIFIDKSSFSYTIVALVFILPFTNSAVTDTLNADHRISVLLPVAIICIALGIKWLHSGLKNKIARLLLLGFILILTLYSSSQFFTGMVAGRDNGVESYVSMHLIYLLQGQQSTSANVCVFVSEGSKATYELLHYKEQYAYFLPLTHVEFKANPGIENNEAYVFKGSCPQDYSGTDSMLLIKCSSRRSFHCPYMYKKDISIYYRKE